MNKGYRFNIMNLEGITKVNINESFKSEIIKIINSFFNNNNINITINNFDIKILSILLGSRNILKYIKIKKEIKKRRNSNKNVFKLNNNKYFILFVYFYISLITNKQKDKIGDKENNIISLEYIFNISIDIYKNNLISFHTFYLFFEFYFELNKIFNIVLEEHTKNIVIIINYIKKIIKISNYLLEDEEEKKLINKDIFNLFEKIFIINNKETINDIRICLNLLKYPKILDLIKICDDFYENNVIDNKNKIYLKNNLVKLFSNKLNHNHLEYFYTLSKKYLYILDNNTNKKNYISLFNGIIKFFNEIHQNELSEIENNTFYCDKYFIFDSSYEKNEIIISPIILNNKYDLGITIIFSFASFKPNNLDNNSQIIFSINNKQNNNNILQILLINNKLYYSVKNDEKKVLIKDDIKYNDFNLCFIYYDQFMLYFFINYDYKFFEEKNLLKGINKMYIKLGYAYNNINEKFNGIMGPLLIFNSLINNQFDLFLNIANAFKGKYYLLGETFYKRNSENDNHIYFSYEEYLGRNNIDIDLLNNYKKSLGNILLYMNPDVILSNLGLYEQNIFRDFQIYNDILETNNKMNSDNKNIIYVCDIKNSIYNYVFKENNIFNIILDYHGRNYIILDIECIFNYLIIINEDNLNQINFELM